MRFTKREQIAILLLVVGIISIIGYNVIIGDDLLVVKEDNNKNYSGEISEIDKDIEENSDNEDNENKEEKKDNNIVVYIIGQVHNPGIAILPKGARLYEAFDKVGGLIDGKADVNRINPAMILQDEKVIYVPEIGEELDEKDIIGLLTDNDSGYINGKIDLNRASVETLSQLPGIGEVIAERIIDYREKSSFQSIEELKNVSGIGDKKYKSIENLITVE
ncbi:helix-hairpin-helix domain-containing protein [Sporosalibacterium faouarense]|uniref:helix-hairpin-helix domain-containing protein n=1 Tax=Sporosalibacterium faouarense TaxID=516123 RepID=UPI00141CEECF|nr:helix-hairpin-helix domain-containing protein [Sporosalibacterium faouarense]MTI48485.1 hypothetical protein [Bacillota bacterium]